MNNFASLTHGARAFGSSGARAFGRSGVRGALPRDLQDDDEVIGDVLDGRFRFHAGDVANAPDVRIDARLDARIDARAPERPDSRAPDALAEDNSNSISISNSRDVGEGENFNASVSHPHGEALGPGARCDCTEREKNAKSAGHTRRSFYRGSARAC